MAELDSVIHAPNRLQLCAILSASAELEFRAIREQLSVSDSVLSKQLKVLEEAGYIHLSKRNEFGRPRTWVALSASGRKAFKQHVLALKAIVGEF